MEKALPQEQADKAYKKHLKRVKEILKNENDLREEASGSPL